MTISIANLTKQFGSTPVLRGIDLTVNDGELIALLGPSGSGKTTLLKIIAGLEWPEAGQLLVTGKDGQAQDWLALPAQARRIGFVFQHYALFPHMTVRDNIAFGLTVRPRGARPSPAAIAAKVDELLTLLQIPQLADRYPAQLSGGQRQRVALGRRWRSSRRCCCWTSPSARSTPRSAATCAAGCARCMSAPARPPSS